MTNEAPLFKRFILFFVTGFGSGYLPKMPGTFGSLVGAILCWAFRYFSPSIYLTTTVTIFFLGVWASNHAEKILGKKDPQQVVIDEVAGMLVTMALVPFSLKSAAIGFVLFRLFDIWKPWPVRWFQDRLPAGWGIMTDDIMAGVYANLILQVIVRRFL